MQMKTDALARSTRGVRGFIAKNKLYIDRARGWLGIPQYLVQCLTLVAAVGYGDYIKKHPLLVTVIGMGIFLALLIIVGLIEKKTGIVQAEYGRISSLSPVYEDIFAKFEEQRRQNEEIIQILHAVHRIEKIETLASK